LKVGIGSGIRDDISKAEYSTHYFLDSLKIDYSNRQPYVIVDNVFNPELSTKYNNLKGYTSNHLTMAGEKYGILNIGTISDDECLIC
jgi:hypothetical protein